MTATEPTDPVPENNIESRGLLGHVLKLLDDNKAESIVEIDLNGKSDIADYMVVASGRSTRQVISICEKLVDSLKSDLQVRTQVEGKQQGDWVLIDAGDIIVHIFRPEVREFYQIEKMWLSTVQEENQA